MEIQNQIWCYTLKNRALSIYLDYLEFDHMKLSATATTSENSFQTPVSAGYFEYLVDEPSSKGGDDKGMTPRQMLCASLASCTTITLRMYLNHKGWDLGDITAEVDLVDEDKKTIITTTLSFSKPPTEEQKPRLILIADKCPVHKLLTPGASAMITRIKED